MQEHRLTLKRPLTDLTTSCTVNRENESQILHQMQLSLIIRKYISQDAYLTTGEYVSMVMRGCTGRLSGPVGILHMVLELGAGRELAEAVLAGGQLVHPFSHLWVLLHVVHQPAEHTHS